jgi:outer membrane protein assembly factor BamD
MKNSLLELMLARGARPFILAVALTATLGLSGCGTIGDIFGSGDTADNDLNKDSAEETDQSIDQIYDLAWKKIRDDDWVGAGKEFDEVERQHPYSVWARRSMLLSAYCYYHANHYDQAIAGADEYISLHPGSHEVAYAFYLKAISLYEQIVDIGRDQTNTEQALVALQDVVQRFPDTEYARDATLKIDLTLDHLAGKEMAVGRYYLSRGDYIGAINRFRDVVEQYQKTTQIAEALERLTEAYYALGVYSEAQTAAAVLGANYPGSLWYKDAYSLLEEHDLKPENDKKSWMDHVFPNMM